MSHIVVDTDGLGNFVTSASNTQVVKTAHVRTRLGPATVLSTGEAFSVTKVILQTKGDYYMMGEMC